MYFRDKSDNEIGGFGITKPDDLLYISEFLTVKQKVTSISVEFDDEAVSDYFEQQVDLGRKPEQFARIWIHCHPGDCPKPSLVDEETFQRVFGPCQWAAVFILARNGNTYARLGFNVGPKGQLLIPTIVDYQQDFGPSNKSSWAGEYKANIQGTVHLTKTTSPRDDIFKQDFDDFALPQQFIEELEEMSPVERQYILDELAERPELWDEESEVMYI